MGNGGSHVDNFARYGLYKIISIHLADLGFRIVNLVSEGVYLHEKCRTNPSRYLPGFKTPVKIKKCRFQGLGFRVLGCGAALKGPYSCI